MLVICEDCAKKYNIDESKIRGKRARFTCNECGHIIIVDKADLSRPLVRSPEQNKPPASSIDLLKEMEGPLAKDPDSPEETSENQDQIHDSAPAPKKKMSIPGYFLIGGALAFLVTNGGLVYILSQHYSKIPNIQMEKHSDLLLTSALVLVGSWAVSFAILFFIGALLAKKVNNFTTIVSRLTKGEKELDVVTAKGPREITNLSNVLSDFCRK